MNRTHYVINFCWRMEHLLLSVTLYCNKYFCFIKVTQKFLTFLQGLGAFWKASNT